MESKVLYAKLRELSEILDTVERIRNGRASPLFIWSMLIALALFFLSWMAASSMWVPCVLGAISFCVAYCLLPFDDSWTNALDSRVSAYQPLDREAYASLHAKTRDLGGFDLSMVEGWIEIERRTIDASIPRALPGTASQFIKSLPSGEGREQ